MDTSTQNPTPPTTPEEIAREKQERESKCAEEIQVLLEKHQCNMEAIVIIGGNGRIQGNVEITAK